MSDQVRNPDDRFSQKEAQLEPQCDKPNDLGFASSKDSDQPRHLPSLISLLRSTLRPGTFFRGEFSSLPLIEEEQDVSYWQKNGH